MAKKYENDFKVMIVELLLSGQKAKDLGEEYGLNENMIRRWKKEYQERLGDFSKRQELTAEQKEIRALKKALKDAELERDILKKAVSIFSKKDR